MTSEGIRNRVLSFLGLALDEKAVDAVLVPLKAPGTDAYAWVLLNDKALLEHANPLPPVLTVSGGQVLSDISKHGTANLTIAALMRPCEIRAAVELFKLKQIDLERIILIGIDCPGAVPLTDYMTSPRKHEEDFNKIFDNWADSEILRPVCRVCHRFSHDTLGLEDSPDAAAEAGPVTSDVHFGWLGGQDGEIQVLAATEKGTQLLDRMKRQPQTQLDGWRSRVQEIAEQRMKLRQEFNKDWMNRLEGPDHFSSVFDACINCHNCMRVCPICYCQQCYFDSQNLRLNPEEYMNRAEKRGALRFPLDTLQFHLGRMSHMVLSCVSCGACEDACPMNIPVAQIFSMVGDQTQQDFDYLPGRSREEPLPLQSFEKDEFCEVESPSECGEKTNEKADKHV